MPSVCWELTADRSRRLLTRLHLLVQLFVYQNTTNSNKHHLHCIIMQISRNLTVTIKHCYSFLQSVCSDNKYLSDNGFFFFIILLFLFPVSSKRHEFGIVHTNVINIIMLIVNIFFFKILGFGIYGFMEQRAITLNAFTLFFNWLFYWGILSKIVLNHHFCIN